MDHYTVLQVDPTADGEVIRAAYRALARRHHPDAGGSARRMAQINEAWSVLGNARRRRVYDRDHGYVNAGPSLATRTASAAARSASSSSARTATASGSASAGGSRSETPAPGRRAADRHEARSTQNRSDAGPAAATPASPADAPPRSSDRVLDFGRYAGWSILDLSRSDPDYLLWLERTPIGRAFRSDIARALELRRAASPVMAAASASRAGSHTGGRRLGRWFR